MMWAAVAHPGAAPGAPHLCQPQQRSEYGPGVADARSAALWSRVAARSLEQHLEYMQQQLSASAREIEWLSADNARLSAENAVLQHQVSEFRSRDNFQAVLKKDEDREKANNRDMWREIKSGEIAAWKGDRIVPMITEKGNDDIVAKMAYDLCMRTKHSGLQQRFSMFGELFERLWEGRLFRDMCADVVGRLQIDPCALVKYMTLHPGSLNDTALGAMRELYHGGAANRAKSFLPSSSSVSRWRRQMDEAAERVIEVDNPLVRIDDNPRVRTNNDTWLMRNPGAYLRMLISRSGMRHGQFSQDWPLLAALSFDGTPGPTTMSVVNMGLKKVDPRMDDTVRERPQSCTNIIEAGATFNKESYCALKETLGVLYTDVTKEMERGVMLGDGHTIPVRIVINADLKAIWECFAKVDGTRPVGGPVGHMVYHCPFTPCSAVVKTLGMPFGCGCGDAKCHHWIYNPEAIDRVRNGRKRAVVEVSSLLGLSQPLGDGEGWQFAFMPLIRDMPHAQEVFDVQWAADKNHPQKKPQSKTDMETYLQQFRDLTLPALGGADTEKVVENLDDDKVDSELAKLGLERALSISDKRDTLCRILRLIDLIRRADHYLAYPERDCLVDIDSIVPDTLHCVLRLFPRVIKSAFDYLCEFHKAAGPTTIRRSLDLAVKMVARELPNIGHFAIEFEDGKVKEQTFKESHLRALCELFGRSNKTNPF